MKTFSKLLAGAALLLQATASYGQACNAVQNSDFSSPYNPPPPPGIGMSGATNPPWAVASGTPDVYTGTPTGTSIFMFDWGGGGTNESIRQNLCFPVTAPNDQIDLAFTAYTSAAPRNDGTVSIVLSDGLNELVIFNGALTGISTQYQAFNVLTGTPARTYTQIIIRPVGNPVSGGLMDVVVDDVFLLRPQTAPTIYPITMECCVDNNLTFPGTLIPGATYEWRIKGDPTVVAVGPSILVNIPKTGTTYTFTQSFPGCGGPCNAQVDEIVITCCGGGDDDWVFTDPLKLTQADKIHRTGDVNIGDQAATSCPSDMAKLEVRHNDNSRWAGFMLNTAGNGRVLRLKGGFYNGLQPLFQVEANNTWPEEGDCAEGNVRFMVRADGRVGVGTTTPRGKFDVNGDAWNSTGVWSSSDERFKTNIEPMRNSLSLISQIKGYTYNFKVDEYPDKGFNSDRQIGFMAQELKNVIPQAVKAAEDGYYGVNYQVLVPVLTEAINEQQQIINNQNNRIAELERKLDEVMTIIGKTETGMGRSLQMNIHPNPTGGKTRVDYTLEGAFGSAKIVIVNTAGQKVGEYNISQPGPGNIEIDASSLVGGTYICQFLVDDSVREIKKFIVAKQ